MHWLNYSGVVQLPLSVGKTEEVGFIPKTLLLISFPQGLFKNCSLLVFKMGFLEY